MFAPIALLVTECGVEAPNPTQQVEPEMATSSDPASSPPSSVRGTRLTISSHCGVVSATVDGRLWLAAPRLGDHNPPPGWDENQTAGFLVELGPGLAEFRGDGGQRARFRLVPKGTEDPNASCE